MDRPATFRAGRTRSTLATAGLLALLTACGGSGDEVVPPDEPGTAVATPAGEPLEPASTAQLGPAGGWLESADGILRLDIPAGALATEQPMSIQRITNLAHGALGSAYRLTPHGVDFAMPVRLTFQYTPDALRGTAPQLLRIARQDGDGYWELHETAVLDVEAGTLSVETANFSDWSLITGARLSPAAATLKPGDSVSLSVVTCDRVPREDLLAPLVAECRPSQVIGNLTRNWSVNGLPGGDAMVGTVVVQENRTALYRAPAVAPQPAAVAVSTEYAGLQGERIMLVTDIHVQSGLCAPAGVGLPCQFDLFEFNGKALPYDELPREAWENPESVVSGRLSLHDFDGDGAGTWSLRIHWIEDRMAGPLEQFEQLAGDFTSGTGGSLAFTVLGGATFSGQIGQDTVSIAGYPFSSQNATVEAQLQLRKP